MREQARKSSEQLVTSYRDKAENVLKKPVTSMINERSRERSHPLERSWFCLKLLATCVLGSAEIDSLTICEVIRKHS